MKKLLFVIPVFTIISCQPEAEKPAAAEPEPAAEAHAEVTIDISKPDSLIGMPLEKVQAACDAAEVMHRAVEIDGEPQIVTKDYRPERLNFAVENGMVTKVNKG